MSEYIPTEARLRDRAKGSLEEYAHEFGIDGEAAMDAWIDRALAERDDKIRADERAKLQDRIEELEKNLSYEVEQKIKLADTLRDERAKRPDRQQIYKAIRGEAKSVDSPCPLWLASRYADAVLALEPEAREEAEYFRDGDGDLWELTDKGEWFHEEEPGEFRRVLSIDAEDQTLTPVGRAEVAPAPEVTDAEVMATIKGK